MSYCRWGEDSEVYVFESAYGGFSVNCGIGEGAGNHFDTRKETLEHLLLLRDNGIKVPQYCLDQLLLEIKSNEPEPVWDGTFL